MAKYFDYRTFFVGGQRVALEGQAVREIRFTQSAPAFGHDPNGTYHVHQAYVQVFSPEAAARPPMLLHHGGGMTGAVWETTPDGRPGWLQLSLAAGYRTYVIDNVERGRAGWPAVHRDALGPPLLRTEEEAWSLFRMGRREDHERRRPFAQQRFPVEALEAFTAQLVPRWLAHGAAGARALAELLQRSGPMVVVAHSQGAECVLAAVDACPERVLALVLIEPSATPESIDSLVQHRIPVALMTGDYLDCCALWQELDAAYRDLIDRIRGRGGTADHLDLNVEAGRGFSHLPMMDHGNDTAFARMDAWLGQQALRRA